MRTVLPLNAAGVDKSEVRLVHQRRGLQAVTGALATHAALSDLMERALDDRQQAPERGVIAVSPRLQERGDVW
jgi:hypothetical protein